MTTRNELLVELEGLSEEELAEVVEHARKLKAAREPIPAARLETLMLSEKALAKDWLTHEEETAWRDL